MDIITKNSLMLKLSILIFLIIASCLGYADSTSQIDSNNINIERQNHFSRHWKWSGIFPFYGGFISDPHFHATKPFKFPPSFSQYFKSKNARYQGFDINAWFKDETSEIILAIEIDSNVYEFKIISSTQPKMRYGFINFNGKISTFIYKRKLAFITYLDISKFAILTIDLPISKNANIEPIFKKNREYKEIVQYLSQNKRFKALEDDLCTNFKSFKDFYEQFEPCPPSSKLKIY